MAYEINIPNNAWSEQTVTLDGSLFRLEMKYKDRTERWYVTLKDNLGNHLLTEKKCVAGQTVTGLYDLPGVTGALFVQQNYGLDDYPTFDNFGIDKQFSLIYMTDAEFTLFLQLGDNPSYSAA